MKLTVAAILTLLGLPLIALAGRPGTPDDVVTWIAGESVLSKRPQVCVRFRNTAKVDVGFFVDWSRNGQRFTGKELLGDAVTCGDLRGFAYAASCITGFFWKPQGAGVRPSDESKFMCLREFEPDAEYCFRFRSYDADGLWSESWSPNSCARTPPVPASPPAPPVPQLTILPAETGRGSVGSAKPVRVLVEWAPAPIDGVGQYVVQSRRDGSTWSDVDEPTVGPFFPNFLKPETEFEAEIPFPRDPPSDMLRYEFRVCSMNWGGRSCSAGRKTPLGLKQAAGLDARLSESGLSGTRPRLRAQITRDPATRVASSRSTAPPTADRFDAAALEEAGAALAAEDSLAATLRESLADGESRRGFDIAMAAARDHTEWGPGKQRILDSLSPAGQSGFRTAISYLFDRNRYGDRARLGASIAEADPTLRVERTADGDARFQLGFDIATAIFGDPALGAQGNAAAGPGSMGIRNSLSAHAQRGFDAAMKLHLSRRN